jgi:hypothetical protein
MAKTRHYDAIVTARALGDTALAHRLPAASLTNLFATLDA